MNGFRFVVVLKEMILEHCGQLEPTTLRNVPAGFRADCNENNCLRRDTHIVNEAAGSVLAELRIVGIKSQRFKRAPFTS